MVNSDSTRVRGATAADVERLADIWFEGWHDAHATIVPAALVRLRTRLNFRERLAADLDAIRVVAVNGEIAGFSMTRDAEVYQFYVAADARGTGVAAVLMRDAEARLAAAGVETAWLACAIGNERAARFYEKSGWRLAGTAVVDTVTSEGMFPLAVWRYEKRLDGE